MDEIHLVVSGEYSDWKIKGFFDEKEDAEKYCACKNKNDDYDEHYVLTVNKLSLAKPMGDIKVRRYYLVTFNVSRPYEAIKTVTMLHEHEKYNLYCGEIRKPYFRYSTYCDQVYFWTDADTREKAEKIAQDYAAEFLHYVNEYGEEKAAEIMEDKFKEE